MHIGMYEYRHVCINAFICISTRSSGHYTPFLLAPTEGRGPFWPPGALQALVGAFGPHMGCNVQALNFKLWKLKICATLIAILRYLKAKSYYGNFIIILHYGSKILQKKISSPNHELYTLKIGNFCNFDCNFALSRGKIWL